MVGEEEVGSLSAFSSVSVVGLRSVDSSITVGVVAVANGAGVAVIGDCDTDGSTVTAEVAADGIDEMGLTSDAAGTLAGEGRC